MQPLALLRILTDGRTHSGQELAGHLGVSRTAVWKQLRALRDTLGLELYAVPGRGYRLARPLQLLDGAAILQAMSPSLRARVDPLEIHLSLDSTNRYLSARTRPALAAGSVHVCLAERQSAGRGRRGRTWVSPFGGNIYLSFRQTLELGPARLAGLSLAIGVAVARALNEAGARECGLKWPNDVLWRGRKLAGVLVEVAGEAGGPCQVVVGIGVNVHLPEAQAAAIDQPWVDLAGVVDAPVERNRLAGRLIEHALGALDEFQQRGLSPFLPEWERLDCLRDRAVEVLLPDSRVRGTARGVDATGALLVETVQGPIQVAAGEVSLRAAERESSASCACEGS